MGYNRTYNLQTIKLALKDIHWALKQLEKEEDEQELRFAVDEARRAVGDTLDDLENVLEKIDELI
jgi:hypothetical protein